MSCTGSFPPLSPGDSVTREAEALIQRYRLIGQLDDGCGVRRDLRGAPFEPELAAQMQRQLVPGVDGPLSSTALKWPIRAGVRVEALFASPWLAQLGGNAAAYSVPTDAQSFTDLFEARTGITPNSEALRAAMRVTPLDMGKIAEEVRGHGVKPSAAFLMLVSRHFAAAEADAKPALLSIPRATGFRGAPIQAFRIMAELERIALMSEDLAQCNLRSVKEIRKALLAKTPGTLNKLLADPWIRRLFDYLAISSDVLGGIENGDAAGVDGGYVPTFSGARHTSAARGEIGADTSSALAADEVMRVALAAAFPPNVEGTRERPLQNDDPGMFYGLNRHLVGAMVSDLFWKIASGDSNSSREAVHERAAALAAEIVAKTDPLLATARAARIRSVTTSARGGKTETGVNSQRDAEALGQFMLPARGKPGAVPRANANLWDHRWVDNELWEMLLSGDLKRLSGLSEEERKAATKAMHRMRALFAATFDGGLEPGSPDEKLALRAICDLAQALGPISMNRLLARAMAAGLASASRKLKSHGCRFVPGAKRLNMAAQHRGGAPIANLPKQFRKGTRKATLKRNALDRPHPAGFSNEGEVNT